MSTINNITPTSTASRSTSSGPKASVSPKDAAAFANMVKAPTVTLVQDRPEESTDQPKEDKTNTSSKSQQSNKDKKEETKQASLAPDTLNPFLTKVETPPLAPSLQLQNLAAQLMTEVRGLDSVNPTALLTLNYPQLMGEVRITIKTENAFKTLNIDFSLDSKSLNFLTAAAQSDLKTHLLNSLKKDGFEGVNIKASEELAQNDSEGNPHQQGKNVDLFKTIREEEASYTQT